MSEHKDTDADLKIKACIDKYQNFAVVAGAGSGKTDSLVKALAYVRHQRGKLLRASGQQVASITYTNAAVEVIKGRTNLDELFAVSTIHGFLWSLVEGYQSDIRTILKDELIPNRIEKKQEDDNGGQSQEAKKARKQVEKLTQNLECLHNVEKFSYNDGGRRDYSTGRLDHDDIIDLVSMMILRLPNLQKIIGQKYPYIFIDEAQDTFYNLMEALNHLTFGNGLPMIGYFGDPMQQIYYDNRAGEFRGPEGYKVIKKVENYRCSTEVIKLLNKIRPDLRQEPGDKNVTGSVEMLLIQAEVGTGFRKAYSEEQVSRALVQFDKAVTHFGWSKSHEVKRLFLTRQMIARRLGFPELNRLFTGRYSSKTAKDTFKEGTHFALKPFIDVLIPLIEAHEDHDHAAMTQIMRQHSPLLAPEGPSSSLTIETVAKKVQEAINALVGIWSPGKVKEILDVAKKNGLINVSERLAEQLTRPKRTEVYDETLHEQEKSDWLMDEFLTFRTNELSVYRSFILEMTAYNTQHGVKGDQFDKVLVVFDDTEASWSHYSFSRLLTPSTSGEEPTEGQRQKSLNLAYVCFSRAVKDLRIILFTANPNSAKRELVEKDLFTESQVSIHNK